MLPHEITDDLEAFTKIIMENEGVSEYQLKIEGQTEKGVNYGSEIVFFNVTSKKCGKKYSFVMKTTRRSEAMRKASEDGAADKREMFMYTKIFPALKTFLVESQSDYLMENVPKTFYVCTEPLHETAIMEDLRANGYKLWDKQKPMNKEHFETVLVNYGKYHAASMAMRLKKPQNFHDLTKDMDNVFEKFIHNEGVFKMFKTYVIDALKILQNSGHHNLASKLEHLPDSTINILSKSPEPEDRVVIIHGDCWNNNMMFKYEGSNATRPAGICFLDFQISSFSSPAVDLSYFMYTSLDEDTITNRFYQLLRVYYDSLASTLKNLGLIPEEVFTYEQLVQHWKKYSISGLIMASTVLKIQLCNKDEVPDIKSSEKGIDWSAMKVENIENDETYKNRIIAIYKNYVNTCLE